MLRWTEELRWSSYLKEKGCARLEDQAVIVGAVQMSLLAKKLLIRCPDSKGKREAKSGEGGLTLSPLLVHITKPGGWFPGS